MINAEQELAKALEEGRMVSEELEMAVAAVRNSVFGAAYDPEKVDERIRKGESLG